MEMVINVNKKGFTLIEILAAIVIMGVISLVATLGVTKIVRDSKAKQLVIIKNTISAAVDNYRIYNASGTTINLSNLTSSDVKENYLDAIEYENEKCLIDINAGYINIIERELYTDELGAYTKEEYCIYFVCNGRVLINDMNDIDYCNEEWFYEYHKNNGC